MQPLAKIVDGDDSTGVLTGTDLTDAVFGGDAKEEAAALDFDEFGGGGDEAADGRGGGVVDGDADAERCVAGVEEVFGGVDGCGFHQGDHDGGGEDGFATAADVGGGVGVVDGDGGRSRGAHLQGTGFLHCVFYLSHGVSVPAVGLAGKTKWLIGFRTKQVAGAVEVGLADAVGHGAGEIVGDGFAGRGDDFEAAAHDH